MVAKYTKKPISVILRSSKTVFTFKDIALLWGGTDKKAVAAAINYYVKSGALYHVRRGIYAKDNNYDRYELATRIFTPAYISFETVLRSAGVIFQHYERITVASYLTREIKVEQQTYSYRQIRDKVLTNPAGILDKGNFAIAIPERAFLDTLYIYTQFYFDHLDSINWGIVKKILPIYGGNKRMQGLIAKYQKAQ